MRQRGYSLPEILIVLVIVAAAAAASPAVFGSARAGLEGRAAAQAMRDALRVARSTAIVENRTTALIIETPARRFRPDSAAAWTELPKGVVLEVRTPDNFVDADADSSGSILYYPDGSSSGGEIRLAARQREWRIRVGLNGRASIEE